MVLNPESSEPLDDSTHTATTTSPKPTTMRTAGHALRRDRRSRLRPVCGAASGDVAPATAPSAAAPTRVVTAPPAVPGPSGRARALSGPGIVELLPGQRQRLGQHARLGDGRHEVGVAGPARHDVQVDVSRYPGAGGPAEVGAHVEAVRIV